MGPGCRFSHCCGPFGSTRGLFTKRPLHQMDAIRRFDFAEFSSRCDLGRYTVGTQDKHSNVSTKMVCLLDACDVSTVGSCEDSRLRPLTSPLHSAILGSSLHFVIDHCRISNHTSSRLSGYAYARLSQISILRITTEYGLFSTV